MGFRRCYWSLLIALSVLAHSAVIARAQDAEAQLAFESGMSAVKRKDFETAAAAFERAFALRATPAVEYNLAAALFELGRFVSVQVHLDRVLSEPALSENLHVVALDLQDRVRPHVARLSVNFVVSGQQNPRLYVDGTEIPSREWSASRPVEPGLHRVTLWDGFTALVEREISVAPGREASLDLQLVPVPVEVVVPAPAAMPPLDEGSVAPSRARSWKLWVGVSAAVVVSAVALGVGLGLRDKSDSTPPHTEGSLGPER